MRAVKYDLCYIGITVKETNDYATAIEWKNQSSLHDYKIKLEEIFPEVSKDEIAWRKYFIAKKNAVRVRKMAMQNKDPEDWSPSPEDYKEWAEGWLEG